MQKQSSNYQQFLDRRGTWYWGWHLPDRWCYLFWSTPRWWYFCWWRRGGARVDRRWEWLWSRGLLARRRRGSRQLGKTRLLLSWWSLALSFLEWSWGRWRGCSRGGWPAGGCSIYGWTSRCRCPAGRSGDQIYGCSISICSSAAFCATSACDRTPPCRRVPHDCYGVRGSARGSRRSRWPAPGSAAAGPGRTRNAISEWRRRLTELGSGSEIWVFGAIDSLLLILSLYEVGGKYLFSITRRIIYSTVFRMCLCS